MGVTRLRAAAVVGALVLATAGCTGDTPEDSEPTPTPPSSPTPTSTVPEPLTQEELVPALLEAGALGRRFTSEQTLGSAFHTAFDDPAANLGCLRRLDAIDFGVPFERSAAFTFMAKNDAKSPSIVNLVGSAGSEAEVQTGLADAISVLRQCKRVRTRDDDVRLQAEVSFDRKPVTPQVDQQLNMHVVGRMMILQSTFPIGMWVSVVRVGSATAIVSVLDLDRDNEAAQRQLTRQAAQRLAAVVAGTTPPAVRRVRLETKLPQ